MLLFGCASTRDIQILDREIDKLYSEIQALKKEHDSIKNEMSTLKTDLSSENQKLKSDLFLRVENLQSEIRILSTGIEEYKEFSKRPSRDLDRVRGDMEGRLKILEERGKTYEERHKAQEGKIRELEDHLKGLGRENFRIDIQTGGVGETDFQRGSHRIKRGSHRNGRPL